MTDTLAILLILTNFRLLGSSRLWSCIQTVAIQAVLLGLLPLLTNPGVTVRTALVLAGMTFIKAVVLPWLVRRSAREVQVKREIEPMVGFTVSLLVGVGLLAVGVAASRRMALPSQLSSPFLVAVAVFTILTGLFLIVARKKAITQVLGYLVMENGIYSFGMAYAVHEPFLVEMGILLDVWAAVFVMGIAIHHIHSAYDHIDTDRLSALKE